MSPTRSFTDIFIKHPVLAIVVNLAIVLVGWRAISSLPVQQYPQIESTSVVITTVYVGAGAETVRGFLTTPIERVVTQIGGVDHVESTSRAGVSTVTVRLKLNHSSTAALAEVTARLQQVRSELPAEAEPPVVEVQRADRPYGTFYLSFTSDERSVSAITDWLLRTMQPQLATLPGVQRVTFEGGRQIAMRVWIDPDRLAELNLSPGDVYAALQRNNYLAAVGQTKSDFVQVNLLANTDLRSSGEFEELIVADRGGAIVRLRDVARIELGAEEADLIPKLDRREAVYLGVWPLPGSNEIDVAARLKAEMERLRPTLPKDIDMRLVWDGTRFMTQALEEITKTLAETILIVAFVVFLFMGSVRTALVPLVAMPVSLLGAAVVMLLFGFSLNLLTILAIVLSVGLVVDDAIVVVENVERHVREGRTRMAAALLGARELVGPIIAMTITLAAVYTPIGFQGGLTGTLFLEFAITLAAAVVVSGLVAVTLSPVMSSRFVHEHGHEGKLTALGNRAFDAVRAVYARLLDRALEVRWAVLGAALLVMAGAWPLYSYSRRELAPVEDQSHISLFFQASPDSSLPASNREALKVVDVIKSFPETDFMWSLTASWGGFGGLVARDWKERKRSTEEMYGEVFGAVSQVPGVRVFPRLDPPLPTPGQYDVELVLQSDAPPEQMLETVGAVVGAGWRSGKFLYVDTDLKIDLPQAHVVIDREQVADLGLDLAGVGRELGTLLGGAYVNRFNYFDRSYKVIPQIGEQDRATLGPLLDLKIKTPSGELVPVSTFTRIETSTAPRTLNRFQQRNAVKVFGGVKPGVTKEEGLRVLEDAAAAAGGPGVILDHAGESRQIRREGSALTVTLGFAVVLIYLVLAAQFKSFRDPLIVLLGSVPLAISGALVFTFLDLTTINIYSQVGLITLVGLIAKNGILIVQFANKLQEDGLSKADALRESALTRLRPVLMTSAATVFGHLPLVFVAGPGAEARNSIGTVLVAGMTVGTIFTLFVVPVFYSLIAARHRAEDATEEALEEPAHPERRTRGARPEPKGVEVEPEVGSQPRVPSLVGALLLAGISTLLVAGCAVGPDYRTARPEVPAAWSALEEGTAGRAREHASVAVTRTADLSEWWRAFHDPALVSLSRRALEANLDLRTAAARLREARASRGAALGGLLPEVGAGGGYERRRWSENGQFPTDGGAFDLFQAGFDASWEVDVFGGNRRRLEAADAELDASLEALRDVRVSLQAELGRSYLELRGVQARIAIARQNLDAQRETADLTRARLAAGQATDLDVARAEAQASATSSVIPALEAAALRSIHAIAALLGREPGALVGELGAGAPIPAAPSEIPVGLPTDLLRRRPDIRRAERELAAATARVGVATADLYPRFFLVGSLGLDSVKASDFLTAASRAWSAGPEIRWPLFQGGRIRANIEVHDARQEQAALGLERALIGALRDVEDALVTHSREQRRRAALADAVSWQRRAAEMAEERYALGLVDFLAVLDAQRSLYGAQDALVQSEQAIGTNAIALYKAVGGGWRAEDEGARP